MQFHFNYHIIINQLFMISYQQQHSIISICKVIKPFTFQPFNPTMAFALISFPFQSKHLAILIFNINLLWLLKHVKAASAFGNETDYLALLKFKESITSDPDEILSSWNSLNHFCSWHGITCSHRHGRVTELNLRGYHLRGIISPHVSNLSFLRNLYLHNNSFYGEIPPELGRLFRLQQLSLSDNTLTGEIPINLTGCIELRHLNLSSNRLSGKIPFELGLSQEA